MTKKYIKKGVLKKKMAKKKLRCLFCQSNDIYSCGNYYVCRKCDNRTLIVVERGGKK